MIRQRWPAPAVLLALALLTACGSGGTPVGPTPSVLPVLDLGTLPSTTPSRAELAFTNVLGVEATVTATTAPSPFEPDPDDFPVVVPTGQSVRLGVIFRPLGPGTATGTLTVRFDGGGQVDEQRYSVRARAEPISWSQFQLPLDFGEVAVGESRTLETSFTNTSDLSPVTFTNAAVPNSYFSVLGSPFPLTLEPGDTASLDVRYEPGAGGVHDGTLQIGPSDPGGPIEIPLLARGLGPGAEVVTDYGLVTLDGSRRTTTLSVSVPDDAISLYLEGRGNSDSDVIGLYTLVGPGGRVYENTSSTGAYIWLPGWHVFSTVVPNTDRPSVQLVEGGGTYTFRLRLLGGTASQLRVRAIVERRPPETAELAVLPLNVFLANGITPTASTASSDSYLQAVLTRMDQIFAQQGIRLGDIDYYDVANSSFDRITTEEEFAQLLELSSAATHERLNLFFVQTALGGGVVGVSATIAGPKLNGTGVSGVMSVYGTYSSGTVGLIAAHELGHFLGLYHTVEQTGAHDFIDDTAECPATGSNSTCPTAGGGYLMHWQAVGGTTITDGQGLAIRGHPHMEPQIGPEKPGPQKPAVDVYGLAELQALPEVWCATCARLEAQGRLHPHKQDGDNEEQEE